MKIKLLLLMVCGLGLLTATPGGGTDLVVIANSESHLSQISADDLRAVFLGVKTSLKDAGQVQPVLRRPGSELTQFSAIYLGKSEAALLTYYRSLVFTGKWSMPVALNSDTDVVAYVEKTRGAIGFVNAAAVRPAVRTVRVIGIP
ncbi:MAG: hypothetical protein ABI995_02635 [Acidobacteriota bacterium]